MSLLQEDVDEISLTEGEEELEPVDNATLVIMYCDCFLVKTLFFD